MSKILVTGVAGMIGSHMAAYLRDAGHVVVGIDDLSGGYLENVPPGVKLFPLNLEDTESVNRVFAVQRPEIVYHFAAYAAEGLSPFIRHFNYSNNLLSSVNVINASINQNVNKVIFTSSMAVYGQGAPPFTEDQTPHPEDPYGISKYAVELDLAQAYKQFGLRYSVARPHNVIGIRQNIWDKYRNVIGIWIRRILKNESIRIFGDGEQQRAFSDIKYCLEPMARLMDGFDGETFNIGSDSPITLNDAAALMVEVAKEEGFKPFIEHVESRHEVKMAYCDHTKAKEVLGFKDKTDLRQTMKEMLAWAKEQPERLVKDMTAEINQGMYPSWK